MLNLDLGLMDIDGIRLKRRRKMLLIAALPMIAVFLIMLKLLSPAIMNSQLKTAYDKENYDAATFWANALQFTNILEPYIAPFNRGNVLFQKKDFSTAEEEYSKSLELGVPEGLVCDVRVNLSLAIEMQADTMVREKEYDKAILAYDRAKATLYLDGCANRHDDGGSSETAKEARERIGKKQEEALRIRNEDISEDGKDESGRESQRSASRPSDAQQKDLKQAQQEAQAYRGMQNRYQAVSKDGTYSTYNSETW